jgi:nicotinate phosphoribosyltransferase
MLDEAGFPETRIVLSNQLDELVILQLVSQVQEEAPRYGVSADALMKRLVYGVGTNLITSQGDPALDGVYKLVSVQNGRSWLPAIKISETPLKTINPGNKRVWRLYDKRHKAVADLVALGDESPREWQRLLLQHPTEASKRRTFAQADLSEIEPLHVDILREGKRIYDLPTIEQMRALRVKDIDQLDPGVKRLINPHTYHVSLSAQLWELKQEMIVRATLGGRSQHALGTD